VGADGRMGVIVTLSGLAMIAAGLFLVYGVVGACPDWRGAGRVGFGC
jgi:hypothetical protein